MNKLTIDKITGYIGYRAKRWLLCLLWVIGSNLLKWMFEGDYVGSLSTLLMLQKSSLNLY